MKSALTFVYSGGRKAKLNETSAGDFFYGFKELKNKGLNVKIIELSNKKSSLFDRLVVKITRLPIYIIKTLNNKNYSVIRNSKNLLFINESSYLSFLPISIFLNRFKEINVCFLPMGLMEKYSKGSRLSKFLIEFSIKKTDKVLFIGRGEKEAASRYFNKYSNKFHYIPFGVDADFWQYNEKKDYSLKKILFIGNDLNRDFETLYSIASKRTDLEFTVITNTDSKGFSSLKNTKFISGNWRESKLSDQFLLDVYQSCDLVILPIRNSTQPSGQSVAMQAMSTGAPVMISKTVGFWDFESFKDNENIFFVEGASYDEWDKKIDSVLQSSNILKTVSMNGRKTIEDKFTLDRYLQNLKDYLEDIEM